MGFNTRSVIVDDEFDLDGELQFTIGYDHGDALDAWLNREEVVSLIAHLQGCLKPADSTPICEGHAPIFLKRDEEGNILLVDANGKPLSCQRIDIHQSALQPTIARADIYTQGWFDEQ